MVFKNRFFVRFLFYSLVLLTNNVSSQNSASQDEIYRVFDEFIGKENSELNNGASFLQQYRTVDQSHMFFYTEYFVDGKVNYKNQNYSTKLKYDLFNDLAVIKYIDSINAFTLSLNSSLVNSFEVRDHKFVKLPNDEGLVSFYGNGFFEEVYIGNTYSFYMKYKKHLKKSTKHNKLYYSFKEENIYLLKYKNNYYEINNKKAIIKIVPNYKQMIKDFYKNRKRKINKKSLLQLFSIMDKNKLNEA